MNLLPFLNFVSVIVVGSHFYGTGSWDEGILSWLFMLLEFLIGISLSSACLLSYYGTPLLNGICLIAWDFYYFVDFGLTQCGLNFI